MKPLPLREVKRGGDWKLRALLKLDKQAVISNLQGRRVLELALQLFPIIEKSLRERCAAFCVKLA